MSSTSVFCFFASAFSFQKMLLFQKTSAVLFYPRFCLLSLGLLLSSCYICLEVLAYLPIAKIKYFWIALLLKLKGCDAFPSSTSITDIQSTKTTLCVWLWIRDQKFGSVLNQLFAKKKSCFPSTFLFFYSSSIRELPILFLLNQVKWQLKLF